LLSHYLFGYTPAEKEGLKRTEWFTRQGRSYFAVQSTQPQTLGYSLTDSPVGLLSWIYEKLVIWTDNYPWDDDEGNYSCFLSHNKRLTIHQVLTWISIYWFSRAGPTASLRIYYEVTKAYPNRLAWVQPTTIPLGYSYFPKELLRFPKRYTLILQPFQNLTYNPNHFRWLKAPNLVFQSEHDSGGHFAAHEKPEELVGDLRKMFGRGGPAFGVVPGKVGYA
jgi:hypothetical protein